MVSSGSGGKKKTNLFLVPQKVQCLPGGGINEFNTALRKNMLQGKALGTPWTVADPEGVKCWVAKGMFTQFLDVSKLKVPNFYAYSHWIMRIIRNPGGCNSWLVAGGKNSIDFMVSKRRYMIYSKLASPKKRRTHCVRIFFGNKQGVDTVDGSKIQLMTGWDASPPRMPVASEAL